ncbi:isoprenylcysteine carboxylmethyltransferase family protein [Neobacillus pocheonensis]|uniref:Isoprenylcysteine carboxylmethyltransferase family protein n=1 Tax=Neobacillus pocheonensis TaxID=363869 RepID=A0ABT0WA06_9BACI|nr:isoprenylcysteine carboxylmethyltransferase family protein [Neobacillus pocheonensis]
MGDSLIIIGMVIRFSAIIQLGRFFLHTVSVVANQELIESGLYRWIRNPSYTGGWLIAVGIGLGLRTWWGTLLSGVGTLLIYAYRIRVEEKAMIQQFEDKYIHYIKTTKKMFPGIW